MHPAAGDKSSRGEAEREASDPGLAEGQQLPSQQYGRVLKGSRHPSSFYRPWSVSAVDICSWLLELLHARVSRHLWLWFSIALPYPRLPNPDQRTWQTPPFARLAARFLPASSTKHMNQRSSSSSPCILILLHSGVDTVLLPWQLPQRFQLELEEE